MIRAAAIFTAAFVATGFSIFAENARAEAAGPVIAHQSATAPRTADIKQARIETSGAKAFIINGRRVLVPADSNAEAVIKALKARYPGLEADTAGTRNVVRAIAEK